MEKQEIIIDLQLEGFDDLERLKVAIVNNKEEQKQLQKAYKDGQITVKEFASEQVRLEANLKKNQTEYRNTQQAVTGVKTKFDELIDANKELVKENKNISTSLSGLSANFGGIAENTEIAGVNVGGLTSRFSELLNPIVAAGAAITALGAAYAKSAIGAKDLKNAQDNLKASTAELSNFITDGLGSGFFSKLSKVYSDFVIAFTSNTKETQTQRKQNVEIARIELQTLQELELQQKQAAAEFKNREKEAESLRRVRDNTELSFAERLKAVDEIENKLKASQDVRTSVVQKQINALKGYAEAVGAVKNGEIVDLEIKGLLLDKEAELADLREEVNGKFTENEMSKRALIKESTQAQIDANAAVGGSTQEMVSKIQTASDEGFAKDLERINAKTQAEVDASNLVIDTTTVEIDETERLKDEAAVRDAERVANQTKLDKISADQRLMTARALYVGLAQVFSAFGSKSKGIASALATANTFLGVTEILKSPAAPFIEPFASAVRAIQIATTISTGLAAVKQINSVSAAAGGGNFLTKGPTLLLVGDNPGGVEQVSVKPISGRGQTRVAPGGNLIAMAGGGTLTTGLAGGETLRAAQQANNISRLRNAIPRLQPVLVLQDFEVANNTKIQIETNARII